MEIPKLIPCPTPSKTVELVGYDGPNRILYIQYIPSKKLYRYHDFLPKNYKMLLESKSVGVHLRKYVVPNHYEEAVQLLDRSIEKLHYDAK